MDRLRGLIYDIKHYAVHDGPGVRTTVFLKGCPLRCIWCHSPESQDSRPQIAFNSMRCIGCGSCVESCPENALVAPGYIDKGRCTLCGSCVDECYPGALEMIGKLVQIEDVLEVIGKDRNVIERSGGGVTVSGGEPLAQPDFTLGLLMALKEEGYHTALDTSGQAPTSILEKMLPYTDLMLYDVKHMDPERHRELTGASNDTIISNLRLVAERKVALRIRIPIIPGVNDSEENILEACAFIRALQKVDAVELLPYHRLGVSKYETINRMYALRGLQPHDPGELLRIRSFFIDNGVEVNLEGM